VKQVARAEADIAEMEARIKGRDQELANPALYQEFSRWNGLHQEQEKWKHDLERLTAKWTDLSQELEDAKKKLAG
jgi:ATP-binding cassette subfamily F protein 3